MFFDILIIINTEFKNYAEFCIDNNKNIENLLQTKV